MIKIFIILIVLFTQGICASSSTLVVCSHPRVCELMAPFVSQLQHYELKSLDLSPSNEVAVLNAEIYAAPPVDLQPESEDIVAKRAAALKKTIKLYLPSHLSKLFKYSQGLPAEELSKFWFFPELSCHLHAQVSSYLREKTKLDKEIPCPIEANRADVFKAFRALKSNSGRCSLVVSEMALRPYLERLKIPYSFKPQSSSKGLLFCQGGPTLIAPQAQKQSLNEFVSRLISSLKQGIKEVNNEE